MSFTNHADLLISLIRASVYKPMKTVVETKLFLIIPHSAPTLESEYLK